MMFAEIADGISITGFTVGGGVVATLAGIITTIYKMRSVQRVQVEQTLDQKYVRKDDHERDISAINKRIDDFGQVFNRIFKKLNDIDARAEERAEKLHRRLDPIVEKVASNSQAIDFLKGKHPC